MTDNKQEMFIDLSSVESREVEWLMQDFIPYNMTTIMEGHPGIGKSYLAMHIAAQISIGGSLPGSPNIEKGNVLYMSAEDDPSYTIRPRIDVMGGNPELIRIQSDYLTLNEDGFAELLHEVEDHPPEMIIIDPFFAYIPGDKDILRPNVIREYLSKLKLVAEKSEIAILLIRHLTKTKRDSAVLQGSGGMDFIGAARSAFVVSEHPDDDRIKVIAPSKSNLTDKIGGWMYRLTKDQEDQLPVLTWDGPSDLTAERLNDQSGTERTSKLLEATDFLKETLKNGCVKATKAARLAEATGISKRTLDRAKADLSIRSERKGKFSYWCLPEEKERK